MKNDIKIPMGDIDNNYIIETANYIILRYEFGGQNIQRIKALDEKSSKLMIQIIEKVEELLKHKVKVLKNPDKGVK